MMRTRDEMSRFNMLTSGRFGEERAEMPGRRGQRFSNWGASVRVPMLRLACAIAYCGICEFVSNRRQAEIPSGIACASASMPAWCKLVAQRKNHETAVPFESTCDGAAKRWRAAQEFLLPAAEASPSRFASPSAGQPKASRAHKSGDFRGDSLR